MSTLSTSPKIFEMASMEILPLAVDVNVLLVPGEVISAPVATLMDLTTGVTVPAGLIGTASAAGSVITQTVTGAGLAKGGAYRLVFSFVAGGKHWATETQIHCVF